ncbi:MAG: YbhB/YbcL family Raf kinase inhibitor-like protein [Myxococcota bacterium]
MAEFTLHLEAWAHESPIPDRYAFGTLDENSAFALSENISPALRWEHAPEGTQSFAIVLVDPDVPSSGEDVNKEGREVSETLPRVDFFHWLVANLPADSTGLEEGVAAKGVTPRGKPTGKVDYGTVGANNYTQWFAGDADMEGVYGGYDGPCPPWNDRLVHRYVLTVYALGAANVELPENFDGPALLEAIKPHVLASASHMGTYTMNASLR